MNKTKALVAHSAMNKQPIMEQVYSIIDSKIQYADYLTNQAIQPYIDHDSFKGGATFSWRNPSHPAPASTDANFLNQIEQTSKAKRLLLIIRTQLCPANAALCFKLLTDNQYLNYSDQALQHQLEEAVLSKD